MHWSCDVSAPWDYINYAVYPSNQSINQSINNVRSKPFTTWCQAMPKKVHIITYNYTLFLPIYSHTGLSYGRNLAADNEIYTPGYR